MIDIEPGITASKEKESGHIFDALESSQDAGSDVVLNLDSLDATTQECIRTKYPTYASCLDFVEAMNNIAELATLINDTLADPTIEYIECVFVGGIRIKLTKADIERRRAEDAEVG